MGLTVIFHDGELTHTELGYGLTFDDETLYVSIYSPAELGWQNKGIFQYWSENIDGTGKKYYLEDNEITSGAYEDKTINLYAIWEIPSSYINYYNNIDDNETPIQQYIVSPIILSQTTIRENYYFICWNTEQNGTGKNYYPNDLITLQENEILNLYAIWEPIVYLTTQTTLTSIANAIRTNNGENTLYNFPDGFISGIENIELPFLSYINGTLNSISLNNVTNITDYVFYSKKITTVNFPNCITIGQRAFERCYNLSSISFPVCTTIGYDAFYECSKLTSIEFPACTLIDNRAFDFCYNLISISFPACTLIDYEAFGYCSKLTSIEFPACSIISDRAFINCYSLTSISFPVCTTINSYAFYKCSNLTSINFPACTLIGSSAFGYCTNLTSIYLNNSSICSLSNSNAFYSTQITSSTGSIYVPASLLTEYKSAPNWSYFSTQFFSIS